MAEERIEGMNPPQDIPTIVAPVSPPRIPDHELLRRIGTGAYGEVWLAKSVLESFRAVKIIHRKTFPSDTSFEREFQGIHKFEPISREHAGLVDILHAGRNDDQGFYYYVMELADDQVTGTQIHPDKYLARTLSREKSNRGKLPFEECLKIGISLAEALDHIHKANLVHRDIKPANVIFVNALPKLADVGLVTGIGQMSLQGTPGFIPPEGPGNPPADVYSLGKVLYEISTGKEATSFPELPTEVGGLPDREQLLGLNEIILKACDNDVRRRFQTAHEMLDALKSLQAGKKMRFERASLWPSVRWSLAGKTLVLLIVLAMIGGELYLLLRPPAAIPTPPIASKKEVQPTTRPLAPSAIKNQTWERTSSLPIQGYQFDAAEERGYLYVIGGWNGRRQSSVYCTTINQNSSLRPWMTTTDLPEADQGAGVTVHNGWVYVALENGKIFRSQIKSDGKLGPWQVEAVAEAYHGGRLLIEAYRDHLYILGGWTESTFYDDVFFAPINSDGSLGSWARTTPMPQGRQHQSVHFYSDRVYIVGGITAHNTIVNSVYSAPVDYANGSIGTWRREADLPTRLWYHNSVVVEGKIIVFGGLTGYSSGASDSIYYANINPVDGAVSQWVLRGTMPSDFVSGPGAAYAPISGTIYLIGGQRGYDGDFTSNVWQISAQELLRAESKSK